MNMIGRMNEFLSVERIKIEIVRTAFGIEQTFLSRRDPRLLLVWYLIMCITPWFVHDYTKLTIMIGMAAYMGYRARISPLVVTLMAFSILMELTVLSILSVVVGGGMQVFVALLMVNMKLFIISLVSVALFTALDPEKMSDAMLKFGMPDRFSFSIAYAYRMLPILIEEYQNIFNSYRLRGKRPSKGAFYTVRIVNYYARIAVKAFYPMMLNTAKRVRTTVEALETKGFTYAIGKPEVKRRRLSYMKIDRTDVIFFVSSVVLVFAIVIY
ncbi:MAG: energy-coupling factor transporter transmembrane component T family protein [Bacilli bacterium]